MASKRKLVEAVAYMRTSSATNVGGDKDSEARQRAAIEGYAKHAGIVIVDWFYDAAVKGAARPGFAAMLDRIASNGVRTIVVESPDRFARDPLPAAVWRAWRGPSFLGEVNPRTWDSSRAGGRGGRGRQLSAL
jgi:hypothetical protein